MVFRSFFPQTGLSEADGTASPLAASPRSWVMHRCGSPRCVMPISIPKREQRENPPAFSSLPAAAEMC